MSKFQGFRVKCFWVEKIEPEILDWNDGIGRPRYRRQDTGEELRGSLPAGALFVTDPERAFRGHRSGGFDGECVVCVLPDNNQWYIDGMARNCTKPSDTEHRCWVRHGSRPGIIHVDKNGLTCQAGAGSIQTSQFHGFLHHGELYSC